MQFFIEIINASHILVNFPVYWDLFLYSLILLLRSLVHKVLLTLWERVKQCCGVLTVLNQDWGNMDKNKGYVHESFLCPQRSITITWSKSQIYVLAKIMHLHFPFLPIVAIVPCNLLGDEPCSLPWSGEKRAAIPGCTSCNTQINCSSFLLLPLTQGIYHYLHQYAFLLLFSDSLF